MSLNNFIPQVWSAKILLELQRRYVFAGLANRDYEGEISAYGDTVKINNIGEITVGDYTKNTDITDPQDLTSDQRTLVIDQAKYFNFQVDDIDSAQNKPKVMETAVRKAADRLAREMDKHLAGLFSDIDNTIGDDIDPIELDEENIYETLVQVATVLDENDVPEDGRFVVMPPKFVALLSKSKYFTKATEMGDAVVVNGFSGSAAGLMVYKSNNVDKDGDNYHIIAGVNDAWTMAEQINSVETYRMEKRFANAVKGLHLYGAKVTRPEAMVVLTATSPVEETEQ